MSKKRKLSHPKNRGEPSQASELGVAQQQVASSGSQSGQAIAVSRTEISSGPLPPPTMLEEYERIVPGSALRIINLAEQQTKHRIDLERKVIHSDIKRSWAGLWAGLAVSLSSIGGGIFVAVKGYPIEGTTIATVSVIGLASVFVYGTYSRRSERQSKAEQMSKVLR